MATDDKKSWQDLLANLKEELPAGEPDVQPTDDLTQIKHKGKLDVILEKKGRGGKIATIIAGFGEEETDDDIERLAALLKKRLGTGGSARGGEILIQGDRRDDVIAILKQQGYKVRKI